MVRTLRVSKTLRVFYEWVQRLGEKPSESLTRTGFRCNLLRVFPVFNIGENITRFYQFLFTRLI